MPSPEVSIIIPVHNSELYLRAALRSVQAQTLKDIEIILVENGSTDGSAALCDSLAGDDGRVKAIHLEKGDLALARNTGIEAATGKYIGFVDADDTILPEMFESMHSVAVEYNIGCVCCHFSKIFENRLSVSKFSNNGKTVFCTAAQLTGLILSEKIALSACTMLVRKDIFDGIRFPVGKAFEDRFTLHRITAACGTGAVINRRFYLYFQRKGSICHTPGYAKFKDACEAEACRLKFIVESGFFTEKEIPGIASRPANLLIRNLNHLTKLASDKDSEKVAEIAVNGLQLIPRRTKLSLRNRILARRMLGNHRRNSH